VPYPHGTTSSENIQPLCARHHVMKHHSKWTVTKRADGTYDWESPTRHHYRYRPPELPAPTVHDPPPPPTLDDDPPPF